MVRASLEYVARATRDHSRQLLNLEPLPKPVSVPVWRESTTPVRQSARNPGARAASIRGSRTDGWTRRENDGRRIQWFDGSRSLETNRRESPMGWKGNWSRERDLRILP